ncbi:hypothetical protein TWF506_007490 [Arthrobotrys conoides]|uniref:Uncharacterized protein n=1 Tax=Arthrobotrys conoides TaxID=74498 RepID=A0AAN8RY35_9PEZI
MLFNIINYTLLFLAAPYMISAAITVASHAKYGKNPSPPRQIIHGVCHGLSAKFENHTTGTHFYNNVLLPGVWLGGTGFAGCSGPSMCGQCAEARDAAGNRLGVKFLIVDYECSHSLVTAPGAITALNDLPVQVDGLLGRPLSECYANCIPTPDLWGCEVL